MSSAASRPPNTALSSAGLATGTLSTGQSIGQPNSQNAPSATATAMASSASPAPESKSNDGLGEVNSETVQPSSEKKDLRKPPSRSLLKPPARPKPPTPVPAVVSTPAPAATVVEEPPTPQRPGPISLPSEPMQYRAIGLLKGKYIASEEQFNRGDIAAEDGTLVDAVLLGRVTSLIKKHLDLDKDHLWVVYPRTLYKDKEEENAGDDKEGGRESSRESGSEEKIPALHVQIVGVWEPETLSADAEYENEADRPLSSEEAQDQCDRFSVRGEIAKYSEEDGEIMVNIVQKSKSETVKPKRPFKLLINGTLSGRTTGYFWDLKVERQGGKLLLLEGKSIAVVPPKKKPKGKKGGIRRRPPTGGSGKPRSTAAPKPKPKPKSVDEAVVSQTAEETARETTKETAKETADA
ncbi:MAG: hypothetical protein ACFB0D_23645 [Phormidesmis sp.]